ncbi:MAG: TlpA disulfide reductase family protein [Myxococcales bacterium]
MRGHRSSPVEARATATATASGPRNGRALARFAGVPLGIGMLVTISMMGGPIGCAEKSAGIRGGATGSPAASGTGAAPGRPAPPLVVERLNGTPLALASLRGKVVLLDVWASWCAPCLKELPMLDGIARRLRGKGVEIVAVSIDQERANLNKFLASQPHWTLTIAHDPRGAVADTLQPEKMPTSYAIDRDGIIRHVNEGFEPADAASIEQKLTELAAQPVTATGKAAARRP